MILSSYKFILITAKVTSQLFCWGHLMPCQLKKVCGWVRPVYEMQVIFLIWGGWSAEAEEQKLQRWTHCWLETAGIWVVGILLCIGYLESTCIEAISDEHYLEYLHVRSCYSCKAASKVVMMVPSAL